MIGQYLPQTNETCYNALQWLMWLFASIFYTLFTHLNTPKVNTTVLSTEWVLAQYSSRVNQYCKTATSCSLMQKQRWLNSNLQFRPHHQSTPKWQKNEKQADEGFAVVLPDSHVVGKKKRVEGDRGRGKMVSCVPVQEINVARSQRARTVSQSAHDTTTTPHLIVSWGADKSRGLAAASGHWARVKESCCLSSGSFLVRGGGAVGATATLPCPPPLPLLLSAAISGEAKLHGRRSRAVAPAGEFLLRLLVSSWPVLLFLSSRSLCVRVINLVF